MCADFNVGAQSDLLCAWGDSQRERRSKILRNRCGHNGQNNSSAGAVTSKTALQSI